jgi:hypothetical protein
LIEAGLFLAAAQIGWTLLALGLIYCSYFVSSLVFWVVGT